MVTLADTSADAHRAMTEACAVVDRSERGKLALTGAEAKEFLHGQVTNDIERLEPGSGCYAAFLTHKGKMLGDLRVLDAGDELLLDCERVALQELFNMIRRYKLGREVELHKRTLERGLLSLIGPDARRIADGAVPGTEADAEVRRVESGRPRYGVDLDDTVIPQEAGLNERAVSFEKGCYVGQETVARLHFRGK